VHDEKQVLLGHNDQLFGEARTIDNFVLTHLLDSGRNGAQQERTLQPYGLQGLPLDPSLEMFKIDREVR
jgi:hypothetical protein